MDPVTYSCGDDAEPHVHDAPSDGGPLDPRWLAALAVVVAAVSELLRVVIR